jgi:hypothetical protein
MVFCLKTNNMIKVDEYNQQRIFVTKLSLTSVGAKNQTNSKDTPYRTVRGNITYPNGTTALIGSTLYTAMMDTNPDDFVVGKDVTVAIQLDGEYAGRSKVIYDEIPIADVTLLTAEALAITS